jgi:peptidoglycan/LPS O-acetylase OafA/YrhL
MLGYGNGVINGGIWAVVVELQFYLLTPIIKSIVSRLKHAVPVLIFLFCRSIYYIYYQMTLVDWRIS